jgi:hypothetical protein
MAATFALSKHLCDAAPTLIDWRNCCFHFFAPQAQQDLRSDNLLPASSSSGSKAAAGSAPGAPGAHHVPKFGPEDVVRTPAECFEGLPGVG